MRAAVRASPRSTAFVALAHALCDAGLAAEAEVVSRHGLAHHPDLPTGQVALARAWLEGGTPARAERALRETIRLHPRHADAYRWLAETLNRTGRSAEAADIWPRARQIVETRNPTLPMRHTDHAETVRLPTPEPNMPLAPLPTPPPAPRSTPPAPLRATAFPSSRTTSSWSPSASSRTLSSPPRTTTASPRVTSSSPVTPPPTTPLTPLPSPPLLPLPQVRNREEEHTPTGSFPPISVTQDAMDVVRQHDRRRWSIGIGAGVVVLAGALGAFFGLRQRPAAPIAEPTASLRAQLDADLHASTLKRLSRARDKARAYLEANRGDEDVRLTLAWTQALLAYLHGVGVTAAEAASLTAPAAEGASRSEVGPTPFAGARRDAASALFALASGNREEGARRADAAAASAPEDPRVVVAVAAARYRAGDVGGAITAIEQRPGPATGGPSGAMRLLLAVAHLDRGSPVSALSVLQPMVGDSEDALALVLAGEARTAGAKATGDAATSAARDAACLEESASSPVVAVLCAVDEGIQRRLAGDRAGAVAKALGAVAVGVPEPRALGTLAQLLANLGEIDRAATAVAQASRLGAASLPAIAWGHLAVRNGRGEVARAAKELRPVGTESRLVAARLAIANGVEVAASEGGVESDDPDLRWLATLSRPFERRDAALFADRLETQQPNPGPVGAYVAGMLARSANRRHLAERWLQQALTGHGDTCRAAREYRATLRQLKNEGRDPDAPLPVGLSGQNSRCRLD